MISSSLNDIAKALNGRLIGENLTVENVFTDSRQDCKGGLFVALKGPHFDAHNFLDQVVDKGAAAIVVEKESILDIPQIIVENGQKALGDLARFNRNQLGAKFTAITGSSGKTTVKEMLASIVQNVGSVFATRGNFNNEIGAPLTLLEMDNSHEFGVIELGANHAGEIAYTAGITRPHVAMINNVAAAHLEGFGDLQGVARAKGEIYGEIKEGGVAVVNLDDQFADYWLKNITNDVITYSVNSNADVYAENIELDVEQRAKFDLCYQNQTQPIQLSLVGEHNVNNALAAASCAIAMGISLTDIAKGLAHSPVVTGRLMVEQMASGCRLIDDSYNANLDSMRAAIHMLAGYEGKRILVIGDMAELGEFGRQCHEEVGEFATQSGIDVMYSCGVLSQFSQNIFAGNGQHFSSQQNLIQQLKQEANANTTILVKGSRSSHMEKVVLALMENSEVKNEEFASGKGED